MKAHSLSAATLLCLAPAAHAQLQLNWYTIDGGGGTSSGGNISITGTIGQPDAATATRGDIECANPAGLILLGPRQPLTAAPIASNAESASRALGLIAQEVEPLFPEVVGEHDGMKALAYPELVPVTVGAIQELNQKLTDELKRRDAENAELNRRLERLEQRLNQQTRNER